MASRLLNIKTVLVDANNINTKHKKIEYILTKFYDQKLFKSQ